MPFSSNGLVTIYNADCREVMAELSAVDAIVCDPPYGLEFMGKAWDSFKTGRAARYARGGTLNRERSITPKGGKNLPIGPQYVNRPAKRCARCGKQAWSGSPCKCESPEWILDNSPLHAFEEFMLSVFTDALRCAKPGAHLVAFGGTRTFHRLTCAIEDAGWEIRDCLMWVYGSGFPKSHNLDGDWSGWGTALKPAWEPIILARKPLEGTVAQNVLKYGTGALNIDGCRVGKESTRRPLGSVSMWGTDAGAAIGGSDSGRWPANLIHDGSQQVLELFPEADSGSAARFFYCAKASRAERNAGLEGMPEVGRDASRNAEQPSMNGGEGNPYNRGVSPTQNHHPTVKPLALMRYLITLVTPPGGTVLDPFMGSGSTLAAAAQLGHHAIGCDTERDYCEIAARRSAAGVK